MDYLHNGDDVLIDQTRNFLRTILGLYECFTLSGVDFTLKMPQVCVQRSILPPMQGKKSIHIIARPYLTKLTIHSGAIRMTSSR